MAAATSNKPLACSWYPEGITRPGFDFFFLRWGNATHAVGGTDTVELTDTHCESESFGQEVLYFTACGRAVVLAVVQQPGEGLATQFDWMAVSPLGQRLLSFAMHALKQSIDCRAVHGERAEPSCVRNGCSLLHLPDKLSPGCLALVCRHHGLPHHFLHSLSHLISFLLRVFCDNDCLAPGTNWPC